MARGIHTRKRSRPLSKKRTTKRRRVTRRGRKSNAFTSQSGSGGGLRYKARKTSVSQYRRMLWNASTMLPHYRAIKSVSTGFNTQTGVDTMSCLAFSALRPSAVNFWTAAGGAVTPDAANTLPVFTGNLILRGGMIGVRFTNSFDSADASRNTLAGTVMLIRTTKQYLAASIPSSVPVGWDPTYIQDFNSKIGKIVYKKNFLLRDGDLVNVEYRLKVRNVDQTDYFEDRNQYVWIFLGGNVDINTARSMSITAYYNISFTGQTV